MSKTDETVEISYCCFVTVVF